VAIKRTRTDYQIRWYGPDGKERKQTYKGISRELAEQKEREILHKRDYGESTPNPRRAPTFEYVAQAWIEQHRPEWKRSTLAQYQNILATRLHPIFANDRVSHITDQRALDLRTQLYDAGLSARRINLILLVLKMIQKAARYPLVGVKMLREEKTEVDPLASDEVEAMLAQCPAWWRPFFTVSFWSGARPGELAALKWGNVDWRTNKFRILARRYRGDESTPKTPSSTRDVDMLPPVIEALKTQRSLQAAMRLKRGEGKPDAGQDYVFTGSAGGFVSLNFLREKIWYPTIDAAKLRRRTFYQTRHTFASNALAAGENPKWVADMLGHKSTQILFDVYEKFIPRRTRQDGSALVARMREESGHKTEPMVALQYDPNTTDSHPAQPTGSVSQ
jgi:integrase